MRFQEPTKLELFLEGFHNFWYALDSYDTIEHFPDDFWEALSYGWMQMEIYPWDDPYNIVISEKRRKTLDQKPPVIYVSEEAYDAIVEAINEPPKYNENLAKLLNRKAPWNE